MALSIAQTMSYPGSGDGKLIKEWDREQHLAPKDRQLYDFLDQEGQAIENARRHPGANCDGGSVVAEEERRAKMPADQRAKLEFLEEAQSKLESFQHGGHGDPVVAEQQYLASLKPEDRALLEKVRGEAQLRPGGVYPFTHSEAPSESFAKQPADQPANIQMDSLRKWALSGGFAFGR